MSRSHGKGTELMVCGYFFPTWLGGAGGGSAALFLKKMKRTPGTTLNQVNTREGINVHLKNQSPHLTSCNIQVSYVF